MGNAPGLVAYRSRRFLIEKCARFVEFPEAVGERHFGPVPCSVARYAKILGDDNLCGVRDAAAFRSSLLS
jgi:hypothetical protein